MEDRVAQRPNNEIRSMTGFGRGRRTADGVEIVAEVRAVNHRFFDLSVRLPKALSAFEPQVRKIVGQRVQRGKIDVAVTRSGGKGALIEVLVDHGLAESYHRALAELKERYGLAGEITLSDMLTLPDLAATVEKEGAAERELPLLEGGLCDALDAMDEMRRSEGAALWKDIEERLRGIRDTAGLLAPLVGQVVLTVKERLEKRVQELTGGMELNQDRLLQEVALFADRSDVTEELTRLQSHVDQFISFGKESSPLGRKLDFLLQELHREVNTIGSKSASTEIATHVVGMKAELEKIREQTQNIE